MKRSAQAIFVFLVFELYIVYNMLMMKRYEAKARAKINISLDVLGKRPDGYHEVRMIMQTIGLYDKVVMEVAGDEIEVTSSSKWIPAGEGNIAFKAARLFADTYGIKSGVKIHIHKRIPVAAGLAGGSSDAASVLKGMNELFSIGADEEALMAMGKNLGADIPYCIKGGTMLAEGIGERLTALPQLKGVPIVLVKPRIGVSTPWVYKNLDLTAVGEHPDTEGLISCIEAGDIGGLARGMKNVLETVTIPKYEIIDEIKTQLMELGALGSMMSGSGPSVFGIFDSEEAAQNAYGSIKYKRWDCFLTRTIAGGR